MNVKTLTSYFGKGIVFTVLLVIYSNNLKAVSSSTLTQAVASTGSNLYLAQSQVSPATSTQQMASRVAEKIWKLPEVQQKAKEIAKRSHNTVSIGVMVSDEPTTNQPYYIVQVYESYQERIVTIWYFRVDSQTGAIAVEQSTTGDYIPLSQWRKLPKSKR